MSKNAQIILKSSFDFWKFSPELIKEIQHDILYNFSSDTIDLAQKNAPYQRWSLRRWIVQNPKLISLWMDTVTVWPEWIPYAVRREFQNKKNPHKKFYMKRTYDTMSKKTVNADKIVIGILKRYKLI